jgi:hypothetical protein
MRRTLQTAIAVPALALIASLAISAPAQADTLPATGTFQMTTSAGILPTWTRANIAIIGIAPGSVISSSFDSNARIDLPVVNKTGTANATAGGFRIVNTKTGDSVRCFVPTVDTRARMIDCQTAQGYNLALFTIAAIEERTKVNTDTTRTTIFQNMDIRFLNSAMADRLNGELDTTVFSDSVQVAEGSLVVTRAK